MRRKLEKINQKLIFYAILQFAHSQYGMSGTGLRVDDETSYQILEQHLFSCCRKIRRVTNSNLDVFTQNYVNMVPRRAHIMHRRVTTKLRHRGV